MNGAWREQQSGDAGGLGDASQGAEVSRILESVGVDVHVSGRHGDRLKITRGHLDRRDNSSRRVAVRQLVE